MSLLLVLGAGSAATCHQGYAHSKNSNYNILG